jgi:hypothetical protein
VSLRRLVSSACDLVGLTNCNTGDTSVTTATSYRLDDQTPYSRQEQEFAREILRSHGGEYEDDVFWNMVPCSLVVDRLFRGVCYLHDRPDYGGRTHLWKVSLLLQEYTTSCPRTLSSSWICFLVTTPVGPSGSHPASYNSPGLKGSKFEANAPVY